MRRVSTQRAGLSRSQQEELKILHRTCIMLRANAYKVDDSGWWGACERCGKMGWLQTCHIMPQGAFPHMKYDESNAFAACWNCHLGPHGWHKNPLASKEWIERKVGAAMLETLKIRSQNVVRIDYALMKIHLQKLAE
jgi:hypothetical protein